ncbi:MAG: DUF1330 domain-containing protein [Candidatus Thiodiazotropha sp. L084R]
MIYTIEELVAMYGEGKNYPTRSQWQRLIDGDMNQPLTVVNFFKLRELADSTLIQEAMTGEQAFAKYAETSVPKVTEVGGNFALRGVVESDFIGKDLENWHIIAIGQYPRRENFLELLSDKDYKKAFKYRQAAIESQNVFFISAM